MREAVFTVTRLNGYIRNLLEGDVFLESLLVQGEISNFKNHTSGHWYFTLKDENAAVNCVMFKSAARGVPFTLHNGLKVIAAGRVSLYEKTGVYQVYAELLTPLGKGSLALAFEQLKAKLEAEGLFDAAHKRPIPAYPRCVAVITSPTGAAARDIIQIARRRNPKIEIVIVPALVQGADATGSIEAAFHMVNTWGKAEVIILARGGGSQEDLWPFSEERTARAVYNSRAPVISAVGHETDYSISDFTADLRAPTPSAAAELAIPSYARLENRLRAALSALNRAADGCLNSKRTLLNGQIRRNISGRVIKAVGDRMLTVEYVAERMEKAARSRISGEKLRLLGFSDRLKDLSPLNVLSRGYAAVLDENSRRAVSAKQLEAGRRILLMFADGEARADVTEVMYAKEKADL
ncbi:MAG: exodeoxyribonuclease VII large subunit [Clostridiales bacterium]|jgi:exodeoxyribonuclease VII large subunit|nr:exodeoxyribonuclease VII large subunit [Clostridiales bacterium]